MYPVTATYKQAIALHRTRAVRNSSNISVFLGQFDSTARGDAVLASAVEAPLSTLATINTDLGQECSYASWESKSFNLDGSQKIPPLSSAAAKRQGFISAACSRLDRTFESNPYILVTYTQLHNMVGITLKFDNITGAYASDINVITYLDGVVVQDIDITNDSYEYQGELLLEDHNSIRIEFIKTSEPYQRIHVQTLLFGIGYNFGSGDIIHAEFERIQDPISLELPASTLEFTLFNENKKFAIDTENTILNYFNENQEVKIFMGYDITGMGDYEYIPYGPFYLSSWTVNGINVKFTCEDIIARLNKNKYYKGKYASGGIRADVLAKAVLDDAGYTKYDVNNWELKIVYFKNPLPIATHAACLQIIANAAMCVVDYTLDGTIIFRSRKAPTPTYALSNDTGHYVFPVTAGNIVDYDLEPVEFVTWENKGFPLSGSLKIPPNPTSGASTNTEFVYDILPNQNGNYASQYGFRLDFTANISFGSVRLYFGEHRQADYIRLVGWRDNAESYLKIIDKIYALEEGSIVTINDNFDRIVWLYVLFPKSDLQKRPRIQQIECSWDTGFGIEEEDIFGNPQGEKLPLCKNVNIPLTDYKIDAALSDIITQDIVADTDVHIEFSGPYADVTATCAAPGSVVTCTGYAYAIDVKVTGVTGTVTIVVKGKKMSSTITTRTTAVNAQGEDNEVSNPLLSSANITDALVTWVTDYFRTNIQWNPETLGFPMVQQHDLIAYKGVKAYITESVLTYSGGCREKFVLRKEMNT
jgi:hypothetical protein